MNLSWSGQALKGLLLISLLRSTFSLADGYPNFDKDSRDLSTTDPKVAVQDVNAGSRWSTTLSTIKSVSAFGITATGCVWRASKSLFVNWVAPVLYWAGQKVVAVAVLAGKTIYTTYDGIMRARRRGLVGVPVKDCGDGIFCAIDGTSKLAFMLRREYLTFNRLVLRMLMYESNEDPPQLYYVQQLDERSQPEAYHVREYFSRLYPLSATIDSTGKKTLVVMEAIGNFLGNLTVGALRRFRTCCRETSNNLPPQKDQSYPSNQHLSRPAPTNQASTFEPLSRKRHEKNRISLAHQAAPPLTTAPSLSKPSPSELQNASKLSGSKRQPPRDQGRPRPDVSLNQQSSRSTAKNLPHIKRTKEESSTKRVKHVSSSKSVKHAPPIKRAKDVSPIITQASKEGLTSPNKLPTKSLTPPDASQVQKVKLKTRTSKPASVRKKPRSQLPQPDSSPPKTALSSITTPKNGSQVKRPTSKLPNTVPTDAASIPLQKKSQSISRERSSRRTSPNH